MALTQSCVQCNAWVGHTSPPWLRRTRTCPPKPPAPPLHSGAGPLHSVAGCASFAQSPSPPSALQCGEEGIPSEAHALALWAYCYEIKVQGVVASHIRGLQAPELLGKLEELTPEDKLQEYATDLVAATQMTGQDLLRPWTLPELQQTFRIPASR